MFNLVSRSYNFDSIKYSASHQTSSFMLRSSNFRKFMHKMFCCFVVLCKLWTRKYSWIQKYPIIRCIMQKFVHHIFLLQNAKHFQQQKIQVCFFSFASFNMYSKCWLLQILCSTYFYKIIMNIQLTTSEISHWLKSYVSTGTCCSNQSHMCPHLFDTWAWATRRDNMMISSRRISCVL